MEELNLQIGPKPKIKDTNKEIKKEVNSAVLSDIKDVNRLQIAEYMQARRNQIIDIKGQPKEVEIPLLIEELILEINYNYNGKEGFNILKTEHDLEEWVNKQEDPVLDYYFSKYLIAWKLLTNDVKIFAPIQSKANINIKPVIEFDKTIPEELRKAIKFEEEEYLEEE